jgi:hypothetical protein
MTGYSSESLVIGWLWEVVKTFDKVHIENFLIFISGS